MVTPNLLTGRWSYSRSVTTSKELWDRWTGPPGRTPAGEEAPQAAVGGSHTRHLIDGTPVPPGSPADAVEPAGVGTAKHGNLRLALPLEHVHTVAD
jgi:hypothetical protein